MLIWDKYRFFFLPFFARVLPTLFQQSVPITTFSNRSSDLYIKKKKKYHYGYNSFSLERYSQIAFLHLLVLFQILPCKIIRFEVCIAGDCKDRNWLLPQCFTLPCHTNMYSFLMTFLISRVHLLAALQRQVELPGHFCHEHVAWCEAESDGGMGWGRPSLRGLAALWRTCCWHHHLGQVGNDKNTICIN